MKKLLATLIIALAITASAQQAYKGDVSNNQLIVTNEQDLVALAAFSNLNTRAWQNPASATNWTWTSDGTQITLTNYNFASMDVVIPDVIDNLPVTGFTNTIFSKDYVGTAITSVSGGLNMLSILDNSFFACPSLTNVILVGVSSIGNFAFKDCTNLTRVTFFNVTSIGTTTFKNCAKLTSMYWGGSQAPTSGPYMFADIPANQVTNYVTNPTATGWGATFDGMPVVHMPVYAVSVTIAGTNLQTTLAGKVDTNDSRVVNAITNWQTGVTLGFLPYSPFSSTITPANGTATVNYAHGNMPSLTLTAPAVLTLDPTSYGTSGVSRVSLSLYCGTNTVTLATNVITYATTPTLSTNTWNTILIRRVSNDTWKGVQL